MLFSTRNPALEIRLCPSSPFVQQHQLQILPTWNQPIASTILVLQQSRFPLTDENPELAQEKDRLREQFLRWAFPWVCQLRDRGVLTDLIDPRSGSPLFSSPGKIRHDDVAAVSFGLGFEISAVGNCRAIIHPQWGTAVYPGTILSAALLPFLKSLLAGD
jgi:hypothetical protein